MAANATAVWRVRPSGNNNNGGGFDCSISAAATGTHGSFTGTTFTDATAAAFTSGMAGSAINVTGIGQYLISAFIDASNITLSGGNPGVTLSGGMAWTVGSGQDYSQQNAAQLSQLGVCSTATVTLTDTGASFTTAVIGNAIRVAGTGITTTYTFITARPSATTLTLQTSPGTTGTSVTYNIGGGWADFWTNTTSTAPTLVAGNVCYILGSGTPNPASYTYDYDATVAFTAAASATLPITFANDPATPGYLAPSNTTGGMPCIKFHVANHLITIASNNIVLAGLWFVGTTTAALKYIMSGGTFSSGIIGCVLDQFAFDVGLLNMAGGGAFNGIGCEVFSSVVPGAAGSQAAFNQTNTAYGSITITGCNTHDCVGKGIISASALSSMVVINSIFAKCQSDGLSLLNFGGGIIQNCTIDGNLGSGINGAANASFSMSILNCIISNHTGVGKYGVDGSVNAPLADYNVYYNNTADLHNAPYGPHDTHGGSNPYVGQSTENYSLG